MKKHLTTLLAVGFMLGAFFMPASALEYTIGSPSPGNFGTPTSDDIVYVGTEATANIDRSKNAALIPPAFGSPTSYLLSSGEPLTPNLTGSGGAVTAVNPSGGGSAVTGGGMVYPGAVTTPGAAYPVTAYTDVNDGLYYSGGYLGTLKIPSLDVNVKVYQGTGSTTLAKGAGHFPDTSVWDGNVCVAAHNRGANAYFGQIHTLDIGDTIKLTTKLGTRTYAVTSVEKIRETDSSMLGAEPENCITLFTCVRNQSTYRWCVRAVEI